MTAFPWRFLFLCLAIRAVLFPSAAMAQEEYSRFEVGVNFAAFRAVSDAQADVSFYPGLGGRFSYNLTRRLALEAEVAGVPQGVPPTLLTQGGGTFSAVFGTRAKILQSKRFAVFGLLRPGLLHFGGVGDRKSGALEFHPHTFFTVNLGGGVEYSFIRNPDGSITTLAGGRRQHSIQTSVAYGWRF